MSAMRIRPADLQVGTYVRPAGQGARPVLYEVEGRDSMGTVVLRNVMVPVEECIGSMGAVFTNAMDVCRQYVLVEPAREELEELLAA